MTNWSDLNARAHGLAAHLLGRHALESLARSPDLLSLGSALEQHGYTLEEGGRGDPDAIELAARRVAAHRMAILGRWAGDRTGALAILFEDEDRRSISALLRGAVQHASPEQRLSGLLPTPGLPESALEELARQPAPGPIAGLLSAWEHPLAGALVPEATRPVVDLMHVEVSLSRTFLQRALRAARPDGRGSVLFRYAQRLVDIENAYTVLALAAEKEHHLEEFWVAGGRDLPLPIAEQAVVAGSMSAATPILATALGPSALSAAFASQALSPLGLETAVLAALIAELKAKARLDPLSPAFLLQYALRLRVELLDLRRTVWGISLGAPGRTLGESMGTPP